MISVWFLSIQLTNAFNDTTNHQYEDSIDQLSQMQIVQWYPDNLYKPEQWITRAEMVKILMLAAHISTNNENKNCFPDVKSTDRFAEYVCTAKSMNIIAWYDDGTFQPNKQVSNVEWLKIALKAFNITPKSVDSPNWYQSYMDFTHDNNIFSKYSIYPNSPMTRGMMAHLAVKIINQWNQPRSYTRNNISAGCVAPKPALTPTSVSLYGQDRSIITDIGENYNQNLPTKLIVAFHGRTNPNTMVRTYYKIDRASDGNVIIVYPSWLPEEWPTRSWQNPGDKPNNLRDYALFDEIVETMSEQYCINKDEIYVVWHSLGGWFTNTLACARGNIIRGIWSVGWSITNNVSCTGPTSAIIMHNPEDNLASFAGGEHARNKLLQQNQCDVSQTESFWPEWWNCVRYTSCINGSEVSRCPHTDSYENDRYYPHTRPDFAGKEIRDFFTSIP